MASPALQPSISIDVMKDLASVSALKDFLQSNQGAIFNIGEELAQFASQPISNAAVANASASVTLTATASWETSNNITFSLTPSASCTISIAQSSTTFAVAMEIDDTSSTTNVSAQTPAGCVYVNIALDFSIQGSMSGSGSVGGVGIAGQASGAKEATLMFCQPVNASTNTLDAIKNAFSNLVFPLDPSCALQMTAGSLAKCAFDGTLNCEVDVTYGLGDHTFSAPSVANVLQSIQKVSGNVIQISNPSIEVTGGIKGSLTYAHSDHFAVIVSKADSNSANLYLVRSSENDWGASVGVTVGVTTTAPQVTIDPTALTGVVQQVTGNSSLASAVASAASQPLNNLVSGANAKLTNWASDVSGTIGLSAGLSRQHGHTALFNFAVDLTKAVLVQESWKALTDGSVVQALALKGFTLDAGSGVSDSVKKSATFQFQFFNLFAFSSTTDYFSNAYTELGPDGSIRVFRDVGQEQQTKTKKALSQFRIHFVATADEDVMANVTKAVVNLQVELTSQGNSKSGAHLANSVGTIPGNAVVHSAQQTMATYVANHPKGTLNLMVSIAPSGYAKLSATPYNGSKPLPLPHEQDQDNWKAFQFATESLMPDVNFVPNLSFANWMEFNRDAVDQVGSTMIPDRRQAGNPQAVPSTFLTQFSPAAQLVSYFLLASQGFMNLCDDLHMLATVTAQANSMDQWNSVLSFLTTIITQDTFIDYAEPILGALLGLCTVAGAHASASLATAADSSSMTCTLQVS